MHTNYVTENNEKFLGVSQMADWREAVKWCEKEKIGLHSVDKLINS